jgi:hypothetical protein
LHRCLQLYRLADLRWLLLLFASGRRVVVIKIGRQGPATTGTRRTTAAHLHGWGIVVEVSHDDALLLRCVTGVQFRAGCSCRG